jgi:hypothetical protein
VYTECRSNRGVTLQELGTIKGHFGPVNYVAISPNGKAYCSGGEEGFIRLNHLPPEFFDLGEKRLQTITADQRRRDGIMA